MVNTVAILSHKTAIRRSDRLTAQEEKHGLLEVSRHRGLVDGVINRGVGTL
jgi:hypothetical protein